MSLNKLSIKQLTTFLLLSLGVVMVTLSIWTTSRLHDTAEQTQAQSLSSIIEVSVRQSLQELDVIMNDLAVFTKKTRNFHDVAGQLVGDSGNSQLRKEVAELLDEQFHQRYVTSNIVDLRKIRIYNLDFAMIAESTDGEYGLGSRLPDTLYNKARVRDGADRLKMLTSIWMQNGKALYSALLPVGGLRQTGYIEIVVDPAHNLKSIEHLLQLPLSIKTASASQLYKSGDWANADLKSSMPIYFQLKADDGAVALRFEVLANMNAFQEGMRAARITNISSFVAIMTVFLFSALWILRKKLFIPADRLVSAIEKCAKGDLTINIDKNGLRELHILSTALSTLVGSLRNQVTVISSDSAKLAMSSSDLLATIESTEKSLRNQRQETDLVATSINEMAASAVEVSKGAEHVAEAASNAKREADNGQRVVDETVSSINSLAGEVSRAAEVMHDLKDKSENIGTVLDVIRGIAEQTNLLALNAAIEAARAGEQGRGFAVVADEVRTLAGRTQHSTQEIRSMIESLQSGTNDAVSVMDQSREMTQASVKLANEAGNYLGTITQSVSDISDMTAHIATASEQQSAVVESINQSIVAITDLANKTSDDAINVTSSGRQLNEMANNLKALVQHFKVS